MTFHAFYPALYKGQYYLRYDSEVELSEVVDSVLHDPVREKMKCPGIILNRFKPLKTQYGTTIKNRYEFLDHTTGWFGMDVDGTGAKTALVKATLFANLPELKIVWVSSSGQGVKAIGYTDRLKNLAPDRFRLEYRVLSIQWRYRSGMKINFDQAMNRCHQPIFINSDPNALTR